jgi:hypothetical protein
MAEVFLDRIEGELAVLVHDGRELRVPRAWLPADAKEGEVLQLALSRDAEATQRALERVGKLRGTLGSGDDGGDLKL